MAVVVHINMEDYGTRIYIPSPTSPGSDVIDTILVLAFLLPRFIVIVDF